MRLYGSIFVNRLRPNRCNDSTWDGLIQAMINKKGFDPDRLSVSYMLAGEGTALGVSNSDPYATDPNKSDDWVKEGPHLMIVAIWAEPSSPGYLTESTLSDVEWGVVFPSIGSERKTYFPYHRRFFDPGVCSRVGWAVSS